MPDADHSIKFSAFLASSFFEVRKGQIVDATIVRVPVQRNTRKGNGAIKEGKPPVENWSEAKKRQKDTDARWTKKRGKSYFGYKNHVEVDVKHKLIRKYEAMDASMHDSKVFVTHPDSPELSLFEPVTGEFKLLMSE